MRSKREDGKKVEITPGPLSWFVHEDSYALDLQTKTQFKAYYGLSVILNSFALTSGAM